MFPGRLKCGETLFYVGLDDVDIGFRSKKEKRRTMNKALESNSAEPKKEKDRVGYAMWIWGDVWELFFNPLLCCQTEMFL